MGDRLRRTISSGHYADRQNAIRDVWNDALLLWCTEVYEDRRVSWLLDPQAARTEFGRPRSSIRLRTATAIRDSVSCAERLWERKVSPMMRL
jgi:hypothetical protein